MVDVVSHSVFRRETFNSVVVDLILKQTIVAVVFVHQVFHHENVGVSNQASIQVGFVSVFCLVALRYSTEVVVSTRVVQRTIRNSHGVAVKGYLLAILDISITLKDQEHRVANSSTRRDSLEFTG